MLRLLQFKIPSKQNRSPSPPLNQQDFQQCPLICGCIGRDSHFYIFEHRVKFKMSIREMSPEQNASDSADFKSPCSRATKRSENTHDNLNLIKPVLKYEKQDFKDILKIRKE